MPKNLKIVIYQNIHFVTRAFYITAASEEKFSSKEELYLSSSINILYIVQ